MEYLEISARSKLNCCMKIICRMIDDTRNLRKTKPGTSNLLAPYHAIRTPNKDGEDGACVDVKDSGKATIRQGGVSGVHNNESKRKQDQVSSSLDSICLRLGMAFFPEGDFQDDSVWLACLR